MGLGVSVCGRSCRGGPAGLLWKRRNVQVVFMPRSVSSGVGCVFTDEEQGEGVPTPTKEKQRPYQASFKLKTAFKTRK